MSDAPVGPPIRILNLSRRDALKGAASSLVLGFEIASWGGGAAAAQDPSFRPNVYIAVAPDGMVTFTIHRSEMGQGIRTSFAMILADEMAASWSNVTVVQADGDSRYGDQDTDASRSMRLFFEPLRLAGASARQLLEGAAAQMWRASISDCRAIDHEVIHLPTGRILGFAQLTKVAATLPAPNLDRLRPKDISSRRYIGHPVQSLDLQPMIRGKTIYGGDVMLPGLKRASIERCPVFGGKVKSFDSKAALSVRGVERIIEIPPTPLPTGHLPLGGIAVIANNDWSAAEGRRKLRIEWDLGPNASHNSAQYRTELETAARKPGRVVRSQGNFDAAIGAAAVKLNAEYFVPYQTHATLEPPVATATLEGGKLTVYAPTQNPQGARSVLAQYLGMKESDIVVRPTFLGNGFGRKSMHDFVCEAGWLAKTLGQPVRVVWTREDDIRHGYYHPMSAQRLDGGIDKNGMPIAWRHRTVFPSVNTTFRPDQTAPDAAQLSQGMIDMPYAIANLRCEAAGAPPHLRLGPNRGGMNVPHAFAVCSFIDELAAAAGKDPANYLFTYLAGPRKLDLKAVGVDYSNYGAPTDNFPVDIGRLQNVLQFAVERADWGSPLLPRQGRGVAIHRSYLSYVAAIAVVTVATDGRITIPRVDIAIDCGLAVNPDRVRALMEDSVLFGIGLTLDSDLTVKDGAVEQGNFDTYRQARAEITPEIHVHIAPSTAEPSGAGDPGVAVIAPAICNALFAATGKRIRALPVDISLLAEGGSANAPTAKPKADQPPG